LLLNFGDYLQAVNKCSKVFLFCFALLPYHLIAQDDILELITDRPDITESASIIHPGWLQIETGFALLQDNFLEDAVINDLKIYNLAGTLLRYGVSSSVELRAGAAYRIHELTKGVTDNSITGISDLLIGTKVALIKDETDEPKLSVLFHLFLPFGQRLFRSKTVEPQIILSSFNNLGDNFTLSYNAGGRWNLEDDIAAYVLSLAGGFSIIGNLSGFAEIFGEFSNLITPAYFFDGGFTYLLERNFQLDISSGFGILNSSSFWFISTGFSVRIPR
jgi:hypothetical protein